MEVTEVAEDADPHGATDGDATECAGDITSGTGWGRSIGPPQVACRGRILRSSPFLRCSVWIRSLRSLRYLLS
jgi:hypothetical protein